MTTRRFVLLAAVAAALFVAAPIAVGPAGAQQRRPAASAPAAPTLPPGGVPAADAAGARDAAALPRYAGAVLLQSRAVAFDEMAFPNARLEPVRGEQDNFQNSVYQSPDPLRVEGRRTRLVYVAPEGRSPLEVVRGYQQAIRDAGGSVVWECADGACGGNTELGTAGRGDEGGLIHRLFDGRDIGEIYTSTNQGNPLNCALVSRHVGQRYALMELGNGAGHAAVMAYTVTDGRYSFPVCQPWVGRVVIVVNVVETARREQRMETVSAASMGQGLAREGRVALYAILFDTGRAEVKPESQPQIAELVGYLRGEPSLRALVVGHTDNQGALDYNVDLSRRRAQAVVAALAGAGIPAARLVAQGVGMAAPLASNENEEGRARNRRVELVRQ